MCAAINFDATQHDPNISRGTVPKGDYLCAIAASEVKETKNKDGWYVELERDILDGPYKGRKLWQRINWVNKNQQSVEIGRREFSNVCHACGVLQVVDTSELHGKPHVASVKLVPAKGDYEEKNEILSCKAWDGNPLAPTGPAPAQAATPWGGQPSPVAVPAQAPAWNQPPAAAQPVPAAVVAQAAAPMVPRASATPPWKK